ncbi:MAG: hypothetical protein GX665_09685 [Gammaproteobacteria bacterium]|nr:hypothetical protein [Gammaproteobacteria bacterium]
MKKSLSQAIALATLVGGAATAQAAIQVNHEGLGGALVYPLYTVNEGNTSLVSVVNTTEQYKAVKVRFVEAKNSAEVLDFHLYLSPKDVWSGTIVPTATGAKLVSNDRSCIAGVSANDGTFPKDGLAFRTEQIDMDEDRLSNPEHKSSQAEKIARVRVGHFEAIEMGTIDYDSSAVPPANLTGAARTPAGSTTLLEAIKHVDGVPGSCDAVTAWWTGTLDMTLTDRDNQLGSNAATTTTTTITEPTGGLYGTGGIVNVPAGWAASFDAVALHDPALPIPEAFYATAQHPRPGSIYPHLGTVTHTTQYPIDGDAGFATGVYVVPSDVKLDEVTQALDVAGIYNDYYVEPALDAGTELVVTFPTKRFYTFETEDADDTGLRYIYTESNYTAVGTGLDATYPNNGTATAATDPEGLGWAKTVADGASPVTAGYAGKSVFEKRWDNVAKKSPVAFVSPTLYGKDEQEQFASDGFISPRPIITGQLDLNYEANVITLNGSNALGASGLVGVNVETPFMEGWLELDRKAGWSTAGVPAVGFGVITTKNGVSADGALRNFAQTFKHKTY